MSDVLILDHFRTAGVRRRPAPIKPAESGHHPVLTARPERERRKKLWREAEGMFRFYDSLRDVAMIAGRVFEEHGIDEARHLAPLAKMENWLPLVDKCRAAGRKLMLTPAPSMADLNIKRRLRSKGCYGVDEVLAAKIDALIEADEAWLVANAGHRATRQR